MKTKANDLISSQVLHRFFEAVINVHASFLPSLTSMRWVECMWNRKHKDVNINLHHPIRHWRLQKGQTHPHFLAHFCIDWFLRIRAPFESAIYHRGVFTATSPTHHHSQPILADLHCSRAYPPLKRINPNLYELCPSWCPSLLNLFNQWGSLSCHYAWRISDVEWVQTPCYIRQGILRFLSRKFRLHS